ncbi:Uncharacterised protein [Legionella bozemanae]|uniref:Uncharacterized protein n=1 Tax=Legionella bozemanae TaxID=447 RepID=A0A0W0RXT0_LEGBO|nr:hypothetical protein Lboz_0744 [Legionella bozemanae]STO35459.1 Uncharacterised protein [Legionella bozemanae]
MTAGCFILNFFIFYLLHKNLIFHSLNLKYKNLKHSTALPKAFTEKGMYRLAIILKSPKATKLTISIIEPFTNGS